MKKAVCHQARTHRLAKEEEGEGEGEVGFVFRHAKRPDIFEIPELLMDSTRGQRLLFT